MRNAGYGPKFLKVLNLKHFKELHLRFDSRPHPK